MKAVDLFFVNKPDQFFIDYLLRSHGLLEIIRRHRDLRIHKNRRTKLIGHLSGGGYGFQFFGKSDEKIHRKAEALND